MSRFRIRLPRIEDRVKKNITGKIEEWSRAEKKAAKTAKIHTVVFDSADEDDYIGITIQCHGGDFSMQIAKKENSQIYGEIKRLVEEAKGGDALELDDFDTGMVYNGKIKVADNKKSARVK